MMLQSLRNMLCLFFVSNAIYMSVAICYGESPQEFNSFLHNWTRSGQDAIFVCCGGSWDAQDIQWQKSLDVKGTRWCGHWGKLKTHIEVNAVRGVRTLLMTYRQRGTPEACIDPVPKHYRYWYAAKWLVIGHFETCLRSPYVFPSPQMRICCCVASAQFQKSGMVIIDMGSNRSREYQLHETDHSLKHLPGESFPRSLLSFSGKPVSIACLDWPRESKGITSCDLTRVKILIQALTVLNATLVNTVLSKGDSDRNYWAKKIDILMWFEKGNRGLLRDYDLPILNGMGAITFYVKESGTIPVSPKYALEGSELSLIFLVLCLAFCFITLVVTDLLDATTSGIIMANDTMLFLVATFYSTSCALQASARFCTSRRIVVLAWVLGSFSISVCFKGQLTSWLVARIPEPIVDDLSKLDTALDARAIRPCVVKGAPWSSHVLDSYGSAVAKKIQRSLDPQAEVGTFHDCFKCASKKGRLCITVRPLPCFMRSVYPRLTESKDPLSVFYAGVPVRKHYPLRMAFRSLVQRVDETDWFHMAKTVCWVSQPKEEIEPSPESLNVVGVAQFVLPCFGLSVFVFFLEMIFGRYFLRRAARLTRIRAVSA